MKGENLSAAAHYCTTVYTFSCVGWNLNLFLLLTVICGRNGGRAEREEEKVRQMGVEEKKKGRLYRWREDDNHEKRTQRLFNPKLFLFQSALLKKVFLFEVSVLFWMCVLYTYVRSQNVHHFALDIGYLLWSLEMMA